MVRPAIVDGELNILSTSSADKVGSSTAVETEPLPRAGSQLMAIIRIGAGVLWLTNTNWKTPPDFGQSGNGGLYGYTKDAVDHSVFAPFSWIVQHGVLPNFRAFGWMVLVLEAALAAFLILGLTTRFWALVGAVQAAAIGLSVGLSPGEWPWSYYLMVMVNLSLWATAAGRTWGLDGVVRPVLAMRPGRVASTLRRAT